MLKYRMTYFSNQEELEFPPLEYWSIVTRNSRDKSIGHVQYLNFEGAIFAGVALATTVVPLTLDDGLVVVVAFDDAAPAVVC